MLEKISDDHVEKYILTCSQFKALPRQPNQDYLLMMVFDEIPASFECDFILRIFNL